MCIRFLKLKLYLYQTGIIFALMAILFQSCKTTELPSRQTKLGTPTAVVSNYTSVTLTSSIDDLADGSFTDYGFCYSKTNQQPTIGDTKVSLGVPSKIGSFTTQVDGLSENSTYNVKSYIAVGGTINYSNGIGFQITQVPFFTTTTSATDLNATNVVLHGTVNPRNLSVSVSFEYGTSTNLQFNIPNIEGDISGASSNVSAYVDNLSPNTTYNFRIKSVSNGIIEYGDVLQFTTPPPITDYDGNVYTPVKIGTQTWLKENLSTTHYLNGDAIDIWTGLATTSGAVQLFSPTDIGNYGASYNFYVTQDHRNVCPVNYHVPTWGEFYTLSQYLNLSTLGVDALIETGNSHWASGQNPTATNSSNFTALPRLYMSNSKRYTEFAARWRTSTIYTSTDSRGFVISSSYTNILHYLPVTREAYPNNGDMLPIRCLKN